MSPLAVALYARVSSDQQAQAQTIDSQVAALPRAHCQRWRGIESSPCIHRCRLQRLDVDPPGAGAITRCGSRWRVRTGLRLCAGSAGAQIGLPGDAGR